MYSSMATAAPSYTSAEFLSCEPYDSTMTSVIRPVETFTTTYTLYAKAACATSAWTATYQIEEQCTGVRASWTRPVLPPNFAETTVVCNVCADPTQTIVGPIPTNLWTGHASIHGNGITVTPSGGCGRGPACGGATPAPNADPAAWAAQKYGAIYADPDNNGANGNNGWNGQKGCNGGNCGAGSSSATSTSNNAVPTKACNGANCQNNNGNNNGKNCNDPNSGCYNGNNGNNNNGNNNNGNNGKNCDDPASGCYNGNNNGNNNGKNNGANCSGPNCNNNNNNGNQDPACNGPNCANFGKNNAANNATSSAGGKNGYKTQTGASPYATAGAPSLKQGLAVVGGAALAAAQFLL